MSGPTPFDKSGLPLFTEESPGIVQLADLLDYINEMRDLYYETQQALLEAQSYHYFTSVKEYGAVGDGVTDDKDALTNAINETEYGGYLYFENNKTYYLNTPLITTKNDITLIIPPNTKIKGNNSITSSLIKFVDSKNVKISGGTIDGGNNGTLNDFNNALIEFQNTTLSKIENVNLMNTKYCGILLDNSESCNVIQNNLTNCEIGIWFTTRGNHKILSNVVKRSNPAGDAKSVGNQIRGIRATASENNTITNNTVVNYDLGIEVWGNCPRQTISNNIVYGCTFGISVDKSTSCNVLGNVVTGDKNNTLFNIGIELANAQYTIVQGNNVLIPIEVTSGTRTGIGIWDAGNNQIGSDYSTVNGNIVKGGLNNISMYYGKKVSVNNNILDGATKNGVEIKGNQNISDLSVINNKINKAGERGIVMNQTVDSNGSVLNPNNYVEIKNNQVIESGIRGIEARIFKGRVQENLVRNSKKSGIYINGCNNSLGYVVISDNELNDNVTDLTSDTYSEAPLYVNSNNQSWTNATFYIRNQISGSNRNNNYVDRIYTGGATVVN